MAPGTTAPEESVTVPVRVADTTCASDTRVRTNVTASMARNALIGAFVRAFPRPMAKLYSRASSVVNTRNGLSMKGIRVSSGAETGETISGCEQRGECASRPRHYDGNPAPRDKERWALLRWLTAILRLNSSAFT